MRESALVHPQYRPDIDGLRAVAVLAVLGYHAFPGWVPGGFVGVDIFFVISGFLISSIIFKSLERDSFSYLDFYARRIKRIFPALLVVLLSAFVFGWYVLLSGEFQLLGKHIAAGAGFLSNVLLWSEAGYFDEASTSKPLLHLWSLGIEEQFYILWPLLLGFVWKRKYSFLFVTVLVGLVSFASNIYWLDRNPDAGFYLPISRAWELMAGGVLAYLTIHRPHYFSGSARLQIVLSVCGLVLIALSVAFFDRLIPFPGWWALLPTLGSLLVIAGNSSVWPNRVLLGGRAMVWVGLVSYPLYLWHWPVLTFARIINGGMPGREVKVLAVLASFVLAWGTYALIEKKIRLIGNRRAVLLLSVSMSLMAVLGLLAWKLKWLPRQSSPAIELTLSALDDWDFPGRLKPLEFDGVTFYEAGSTGRKTVFFGDSLVQQYSPRILRQIEADPGLNSAVFVTAGGCPPIPNVYKVGHPECTATWKAATDFIGRDDVGTVVIGGSWNFYLLESWRPSEEAPQGFTFYYQGGDQVRHGFRDGSGSRHAFRELESFLGGIARKKRVYLLLDNVRSPDFHPLLLLEGSRLSRIGVGVGPAKSRFVEFSPAERRLRAELSALAGRVGARIIDPALTLCPSGQCIVISEDGRPVYKDDRHLRPYFVEESAAYLDATLK